MAVSFIQRSSAKRQAGGSGVVSLAPHASAAVGDIQMVVVSCFSGNAVSISGSSWATLHSRANSYSKIVIYTRVLASPDLTANIDVTVFDYSNVDVRTYRVTGGEAFKMGGAGDGLIAGDVYVTTNLVRCWASAQINTSGGTTKTLTAPSTIVNTPSSTTYNWYDGGLVGDDYGFTPPANASTPGVTHSGGTETISPQWANVLIEVIDVTGATVTNLAAQPLDGGARVTWDATAGAATYDYRVNGGTPVEVTTNSATITGLTNGTSYLVEVRPKNPTSTGNWTSVSVTPSSQFLLDDFNRANSTTDPGTPIQGGPYTVRSGTWGISSNALYTSASTAEAMLTFPAAIDIDATLTVSAFGPNGGLMFRWVDANNTWLINFTTTQISLWRRTAGTWTQHGNTWAKAPVAGDVIRLLAVGRTILVYRNGVEILTGEDVFISAATATMGFRLSSDTTTRLDQISVIAGVLPGGSPGDLVIPDRIATDPSYGQGHLYKGRDTKLADQGAVA